VISDKAWKKRPSCKCGARKVKKFSNPVSSITGLPQPKEILTGKLSELELQGLWDDFNQAVDLFQTLQSANVPMIAIENPIMSSLAKGHIWGKRWEQLWKNDGTFSQSSIQPWHFADGLDSPDNYSKETFLWLKNLPALNRTGDPSLTQQTSRKDIHEMRPSEDRWKARSKFPTGISEAMAKQWGDAALNFKTKSLAA